MKDDERGNMVEKTMTEKYNKNSDQAVHPLLNAKIVQYYRGLRKLVFLTQKEQGWYFQKHNESTQFHMQPHA